MNKPPLFENRSADSMTYQAVVTSLEGLIQQIACCYLRWGYWFYVTGHIRPGKDPRAVDSKLIEKYGIGVSESTRLRRKRAGLANLQYLRHDRLFVLMATKGEHRFREEEGDRVRDIRRVPIRYAGYSISYRRGGRKRDGTPDDGWHAHVELDRRQYLDLRDHFADVATRRSAGQLALAFYHLEVEPYAPVRRQLLKIRRLVNRLRKKAGMGEVPIEAIPMKRRIVRPFEGPRLPIDCPTTAPRTPVRGRRRRRPSTPESPADRRRRTPEDRRGRVGDEIRRQPDRRRGRPGGGDGERRDREAPGGDQGHPPPQRTADSEEAEIVEPEPGPGAQLPQPAEPGGAFEPDEAHVEKDQGRPAGGGDGQRILHGGTILPPRSAAGRGATRKSSPRKTVPPGDRRRG